jgi:hypothetical protein
MVIVCIIYLFISFFLIPATTDKNYDITEENEDWKIEENDSGDSY